MVDRFLRSIPNTFLQACAYARSAKRKWSAYRNTRVKKMWERVDPYEGKIAQGCLTCPPVQPLARFDMVIAFGFGYAAATKDGDLVFMERSIGHDVCSELSELWDAMGPNGYRDQGYPIVADIEEPAKVVAERLSLAEKARGAAIYLAEGTDVGVSEIGQVGPNAALE